MTTATIDATKLEAFVGQALGELGATLNAALVVIGDGSASTGPWPAPGRRRRPSWPSGPAPPSATSASGSTPRPRAATSTTTRPMATLHAAARAGRRARRRDEPGVPARRLPARSRRPSRDEPSITEAFRTGGGLGWHEHSHGSSTAPSGSSGPATPPTWSADWIPALDGVEAKLQAGATRRRRRLRPRRLDDPHGAGVPELAVRRLRLPRGVDRDRARARAPRRASPTACASRSPAAKDLPGRGLRPRRVFDCLHDMGDPVGRGAPRARAAGAGRHLAARRAVRRRPGRGQPQPGRAASSTRPRR